MSASSGFNPPVYETLADMRAIAADQAPGPGPSLAALTGGSVAFDHNPGGLYAWNAASTAAESATVVKITAVTTGRYIKIST